MTPYSHRIGLWGLLTALLLCSVAEPSTAAIFTLDFDGLQDMERVRHYYDNGVGSLGSGPGENYGIYFSNNAMARYANNVGGSGYFVDPPSPYAALTFDQGHSVYAMVTGGFDTGLSFYYATLPHPASVGVYSGLNASGSLLASMDLTGTSTGGDWRLASLSFTGVAHSVVFAGTANYTVLDNITLGSDMPADPVPEPASLMLLGSGLIGLSLARRRRS